jgi:hypothetical protein
VKYWRTARISSFCVPVGYLVAHDVGCERGETQITISLRRKWAAHYLPENWDWVLLGSASPDQWLMQETSLELRVCSVRFPVKATNGWSVFRCHGPMAGEKETSRYCGLGGTGSAQGIPAVEMKPTGQWEH